MKLFYFSGTGNCHRVAKKICVKFQNVKPLGTVRFIEKSLTIMGNPK